MTRREFLNRFMGGAAVVALGGTLYPLVRFLKPPVAVSRAIGQVVNLGPLSAFPQGQLTAATVADKPVIVTRAANTVTVYSAICTHLGCVVAPKGSQLSCPCHGSIFSGTGTVAHGPATLPLPTYHANVSGGSLLVGAIDFSRASYPSWYKGQFQ